MRILMSKQKTCIAFSTTSFLHHFTIDMIHKDVRGIAPHLSWLGYKYFCSIHWWSLLIYMDLVFAILDWSFPTFQKSCNMIQTQFGKNIKILWSDLRREYLSKEFSTYLSSKGIIH